MILRYCTLTLVVLYASTSPTALAQTQAAEANAGPQIEDIVVTAQRREQSLQNVPVAITALGSGALATAGVSGGIDLGKAVPTLEVNLGTGAALIFLRGIGTSVSSAGNEASVATYVDGVYYARVSPSFLDFNNIERVEVLKGPQGTLFGRNASGGAIQIVTRNPGAEPHFEGGVSYANYEKVSARAYLSGGIVQGVNADLAIVYSDQGNGWGRNVTTGQDAYKARSFAARTKWVFEPSDRTMITLTGEYGRYRGDLGLASAPYEGTTVGSQPGTPSQIFPALPGFYDVRNGIDNLQIDKTYGGALRIEQDLSFAKIVSITAYKKSDINVAQYDVDYLPDDYFHAVLDERSIQKSQEIQLLSNTDSRFTWILGGFYLDSEDGYKDGKLGGRQFEGAFGFPGAELRFVSNQRIKSLAGYGQATVEVLPETNVTVGLRYTRDKVRITGSTAGAIANGPVLFPGGPDVDDSTTFKKLTWKGSIDHRLFEGIMAYASISRGFKAGTYVTLPATSIAARPEVLDAYEVGLKTELFDRRLRFNIAAFHYSIKDPQVEIINGPAVIAINAGGARINGIDFDFELAATSRLTIRGGAGYLDTKYTDFTNAPYGAPNPATGGNFPIVPLDVTGFEMQRAPKFTGNVNATYTIPLASGGNWSISGSISHNDGFFWQPTHRIRQRPYTLVDAQLGYSFPDDAFSITVWGKNLTKEKYYTTGYEQGGPFGNPSSPAAPRTYGVTLGAKF